MSSDRIPKSGLFLLETYIVPGHVFYMEFDRKGEKALKPIISPFLREEPSVLKALKEDVGDLTSFVKCLQRNKELSLQFISETAAAGATENAGIFLLGGFRQGFLRFFRDERNRPVICGTKTFFASLRNAEALLQGFIDAVNGYGPEDEEILFTVPERKPEPDRIIRLVAANRNEYDTVNSEFTITFLTDPEEEESRKKSRETVRENAEFALQKTTEILNSMTGRNDGKEKEEES